METRNLLIGAAAFAATASASALDIQIIYDTTIPGAVDCCGDGEACCGNVDELLWHVGIAAAMWSDIIEDDVTLTLRYCFADISSPDATATAMDALGRPTEGRIRIPYDLGLWWDSTPNNAEEFEMTPRLYRNTHPAEQAEAFLGVPPEILEVGYNGFGPGGDALSIILHEIGHVLGLNNYINPCGGGGATFYFPPPEMAAGGGWAVKGYTSPSGSDCNHLALGGIQECDDEPVCESHQALMWTGMLPNARAHPSITDIAAIAVAGNWEIIDLPRKYSIQSGTWGAAGPWLGERAPDAGDDVYLINETSNVSIESFGLQDARNVYVGGDNNLSIVTGTLDVSSMNVRDAGFVVVDIGATLDSPSVEIEADAGLLVRTAAVLDAFQIQNDGELSGGGTVTTTSITSGGTIRVSGGDLYIQSTNAADLDGNGSTHAALIANVGDLTIDAEVPEPVLADVTVGAGRTIHFTHGWAQQNPGILDLAITLDGDGADATIAGDSVIAGPIDVIGSGVFADEVTYNAGTQVALHDGSLLSHNGLARYRGGVFAGNGTIYEGGGAFVELDTILGPLDVYDMDGSGSTTVSVQADAWLTVLADSLEVSALDGFDGNLNVDGTCVITTAAPWRLEGVIFMNLAGGTTGRLAGSQIEVEGTISGRHLMELDSPVRVHSGANIHTIDAATQLVLDSTSQNELAGGSITGVGTAFIAPQSSLFGVGSVEPTLWVDGVARAGDGWLILNRAPVVNGTLGTTNENSVLFVAESWANDNGVVNLRNGWFGGEPFINRADTTGHGILGMTQVINEGRLAPGVLDAPGDGSEGVGLLAFFEFTQTDAGRTELMIGGLVPGDSDGLIVNGTANLAGELALSLEPGFLPEVGDVIPIMTYSSRVGEFASVSGTQLPGGRAFVVGYAADHAYVEVVAGCAGDVDGDGMIAVQDLLEVVLNWGPCTGTSCPADLDGSGIVDVLDLIEVLTQWGSC